MDSAPRLSFGRAIVRDPPERYALPVKIVPAPMIEKPQDLFFPSLQAVPPQTQRIVSQDRTF